MRTRILLVIVVNLWWTIYAGAQAALTTSGQQFTVSQTCRCQACGLYAWARTLSSAQRSSPVRSFRCGAVNGARGGTHDHNTYAKAETADYINQYFVAVKVDSMLPLSWLRLQASTSRVESSRRAASHIIFTPDGRLYLEGEPPAEHKDGRPSFRETADEALLASRINPD